MPSSASDSSKNCFDTSSNAFSWSRKIVAERDLYAVLKEFIVAAVCINVTMASIVRLHF